MLPKSGMLGASPHHGRQTPKHSSTLLDVNLTQKSTVGFLDSSKHLREVLTPPQHSDELRQMNQCPPRDGICCIKSNICIKQNIYFVDTDQF